MDAFRTWHADLTDFLRSDTYPQSLYATGNYLQITQRRIQDFISFNSQPIYFFGNIFGMFLLGLYVGKRRIFQEFRQHLLLLRRVMWAGLGIGLTLNGAYVSTIIWPERVPLEYYQLVQGSARTIGAPALMLFYVSAIILLVQKDAWRRRLAPLANLGRGALSNYLLQSILCTLLFYNYGLGLTGQVSPAFGLILTLVIYWLQIRISEWWFDRYQFGPLEWVWRTLTYGGRQPLRHGETFGHLETTPRWPTVRRVAARADRKTILAGASAVLLLCTGIAVVWRLRVEPAIPQISFDVSRPKDEATATPFNAQATSASDPQSGDVAPVATPVVRAVAYHPGPIAASGDLLALASTFSEESALSQIDTLTGPPYLGRYAGSSEGWAAGDYIAQQFAEYGLQPAGDEGTFFQPFPVEYVALVQEPRLVVEGPNGTVFDRYALHQDFSTVARWYAGAGSARGEVVWASNCAHDDFNPPEVVDKIVLCRSISIREATRYALEYGAAGLLLLTDPDQYPPDFGTTYFESWVPEAIPTFRVFPSVAQDLLLGSGKSVEELSFSPTPFSLSTRARMEVRTAGPETCAREGCQGRNVLGVIPGRDPQYADQVIVIGAHYDHLGQTPDGTVWVGANDDASGVAVLLEIARSWHAQGYVPRRTVLFAAWDAEEEGLWGSTYYVEHPRYPLENTVAKIQLDMVGAGGDTLLVDGGGELAGRIQSVAEHFGTETESSNSGRSDHMPFLQAGVPANLLIWSFEDGAEPQYHRPGDTPEAIEPSKLGTVGKIVGLTVLGLVEAEPAIDALLAQRAAAVECGDLEAFLATSLPEQAANDRPWFADVQTLAPTRLEMQARNVRVFGRTATATVQIRLEHPVKGKEGETEELATSLSVKFAHRENGWKWAGPNLMWQDPEAGFAVAYPPPTEKELGPLGQLAAERYAEIASLLGLPTEPDAALMLFPTSEALRASTALSLAPSQDTWVGPGTVKLVYHEGISASAQLTTTLAQLALAEAGVTDAAAPWLWQGLPLLWRAGAEPVETQTAVLPHLQKALATKSASQSEATAWAAVDYLRRRVGWPGIGRFVSALGGAYRDGLCPEPEAVNVALSHVLHVDLAAFEASWQAGWRERLATAQAGLDAVLAARSEAVLAGDEVAFLKTVDPNVPNLMAEEQHWLADLADHPLESFSLTGQPLAFLEDGSMIADIAFQHRPSGLTGRRSEARVSLPVWFTPSDDGYRWAGVHFEKLAGDRVSVLYQAGQEALAQALLEAAEAIYAQLAADLGVGRPDDLAIKLYGSQEEFRTSVFLSFPPSYSPPAWTGKGESVKFRWQRNGTLEDYRPALAAYVARHLLYQIGVDSEWLIKGTSIYLSQDFDAGAAERTVAENLLKVLRAVPKGALYDLEGMPPDDELSQEELGMANTQAWDAVRYLVYTHGRVALIDLLHRQGQGLTLDAALRDVIGQTTSEFEAAWAKSIARAHALPEWIEMANAFDPELAMQHVEYLSSPELAGRQPGSAGAETAAAYIAARFAEYGLVPVGDSKSEGTVGQGAAFLQHFPISYTTWLSAPRFEIGDEAGRARVALTYRQDFLTLLNETAGEGAATGGLVFVRDPDYQGMKLSGKIVIRRSSSPPEIEMARAIEAGAEGLVLMGDKEGEKKVLAKDPLPVEFRPGNPIPVLELTRQGYSRLLQAAGHTETSILNSPPALLLDLEGRIEIPLSEPETVETANVLGLLPGSDPILRQEAIVLGAHYDHVGDDPDILVCPPEASDSSNQKEKPACQRVEGRRYAGVNDNASGVAVLLEIARLWHEKGYPPQRSVLFAAWGAQESGEAGSRYYVENPPFSLEKTVAALELDTVGGGDGYYLEARGGQERDGLLLFSVMGVEDWVDGRLALRGPSERSDRVPFGQAGLPTLLLTWREASEENWPVEMADEVQPYRLGVSGRTVTLALMTLAR
jgi:Zn-dependent M28 family amino/carboxypeptidase